MHRKTWATSGLATDVVRTVRHGAGIIDTACVPCDAGSNTAPTSIVAIAIAVAATFALLMAIGIAFAVANAGIAPTAPPMDSGAG